MHLMIPSASALGEACQHTRSHLKLPQLAGLLGLLTPDSPPVGGDATCFNTPFEAMLARLRIAPSAPDKGLSRAQPQAISDGHLPVAAWLAQAAGEDPRLPWALLTPLHLTVGSDGISAYPPSALNLTDDESQAYFNALAELWPTAEGWQARWVSRYQWLLTHPCFEGVASASLERVIHRNVDAWMPEVRHLRTLQNEVQMLLHRQPLNEAREAQGKLALNSVWISGCGSDSSTAPALPPFHPFSAPLPNHDPAIASATPTDKNFCIDLRLQTPMIEGDWASWGDAWAALDAGPILTLRERASLGESVRLTLCGERFAQSYALPQRSTLQKTLQRWLPPRADVAAILEAL
ncbi:hypothetical protein [Roseateles koreensis]|uniref:Phosphoglycerate mutase n=1 Tax=Roseateles koreensis TaxID=2987526 RepID=A0ABT5KV66_9BURK|nr:hypothetical protein [Roseateles koreensis]MDC8786263.1 hypothetical protein [Roseateles koreensis]